MSHAARRTASWLLVLATIVGVMIGWDFVPGSGGVADELRWLLARDALYARHTNRASQLIYLAEKREPGTRGELFKTLLFDEDQRVVRGALTLLADQLILRGPSKKDLRAAFATWLRASPRRTKAADELLSRLFGPEWRELCESGGAASQPGAGDGGG